MAKPVTHTVNFLSAAEEDLHRYTKITKTQFLLILTARAISLDAHFDLVLPRYKDL